MTDFATYQPQPLAGGTDSTPIGNIADSLKVSPNNAPTTKVVPFTAALKSAGSEDMIVVGSTGTPVHFDWSPTVAPTYVTHLTLAFKDTGTLTYSKFGLLTALTNGVVLKATVAGTEYTISNFKMNYELLKFFGKGQQGAGGFAEINTYSAAYEFPIAMTMTTTNDRVRASVQDTLTGLDFFRIGVVGYVVV